MDFEYVLAELMGRADGALGVMLLDAEGEAVDVLGSYGSIHDVKVLGAYQGIFLSRARGLLTSLEQGECRELELVIGDEVFMTHVLPDGYYVTLIVDSGSLVSRARNELRRAVTRIEKILF